MKATFTVQVKYDPAITDPDTEAVLNEAGIIVRK